MLKKKKKTEKGKELYKDNKIINNKSIRYEHQKQNSKQKKT